MAILLDLRSLLTRGAGRLECDRLVAGSKMSREVCSFAVSQRSNVALSVSRTMQITENTSHASKKVVKNPCQCDVVVLGHNVS
jgi:hypothetical protein